MSTVLVGGFLSDDLLILTGGYESGAGIPPTPPPTPPTVYVFTLTDAEGGYTDLPPGVYAYNAGVSVTVSAIPYSGFRFVKWSNDSAFNPLVFTVSADVSLYPIFVVVPTADYMTPFDYVVSNMEAKTASTLFDSVVARFQIVTAADAAALFDKALLKFTSAAARFGTVYDESVVFDVQIFDVEIFY